MRFRRRADKIPNFLLRNFQWQRTFEQQKSLARDTSEKMGLFFRGWQGGRRRHLARSPGGKGCRACRNDQDRSAGSRGVHDFHRGLRLLLQERQEVSTEIAKASRRQRRKT